MFAPRRYDYVASRAVAQGHPDGVAEGPLVLIVEDDLSTRAMYRDYLTHCGFRIVDAHNGHQALEKSRRPAPGAYGPDYTGPRPAGLADPEVAPEV